MKKLLVLIFSVFVLASCHQRPAADHMQAKSMWKPYSQHALVEAMLHKKPVVIDFTADWCPNCHDLERSVFADPQFISRLAQYTALRVDVTNMDDARVQQIIQEYDVEGVPTVIFLDSHGHEIKDSRIIGAAPSRDYYESLALLK